MKHYYTSIDYLKGFWKKSYPFPNSESTYIELKSGLIILIIHDLELRFGELDIDNIQEFQEQIRLNLELLDFEIRSLNFKLDNSFNFETKRLLISVGYKTELGTTFVEQTVKTKFLNDPKNN